MFLYDPYMPSTSAVEPLFGEQSTDAAARQATEPQKYGDEFNPKPHPDLEAMTSKYQELEEECTRLCDRLYMGNPTALERERLHKELRRVEDQKGQLWLQLMKLAEGLV